MIRVVVVVAMVVVAAICLIVRPPKSFSISRAPIILAGHLLQSQSQYFEDTKILIFKLLSISVHVMLGPRLKVNFILDS